MNATTTTQRIPVFEIARLACQIWQKEARQSVPEEEYWLQAEWQLRAISQPGHGDAKTAPSMLKASPATARNSFENL